MSEFPRPMSHPMSNQRIDLADYRDPKVRVFAGRDRGISVRNAVAATLSAVEKHTQTVTIEVPSDVFAVTSSFLLAFLGDTIRALGRDEFLRRVRWTGKDISATVRQATWEALEAQDQFSLSDGCPTCGFIPTDHAGCALTETCTCPPPPNPMQSAHTYLTQLGWTRDRHGEWRDATECYHHMGGGEAEQLEADIASTLRFCGCGRPGDALSFVADVLTLYSTQPIDASGKWSKALYAERDRQMTELCGTIGAKYFVWYMLSDLKLMDHGGSVPGWPTPRGKLLIDAVQDIHNATPDGETP